MPLQPWKSVRAGHPTAADRLQNARQAQRHPQPRDRPDSRRVQGAKKYLTQIRKSGNLPPLPALSTLVPGQACHRSWFMSKKHAERIDPQTVSLPPYGIDSHAHLTSRAFTTDREEVLARARACGLCRIANVFLNPDTFPEEARLFDDHPEVFFLLGVHPDDTATFTPRTLETIRRHVLDNPRIRAIGEIGLDFSRSEPGTAHPSQQLAPFIAQLHLARELDMPIAIHCRDAVETTITILEKEGFSGYPLVWHCFGADKALAERLVAHDWYVSFPGTVTFKNNPQSREALPCIPDNRLLVETDCPYLSPMPWRGTRNEPAYTVFTIRTMAQSLGVEPEVLWQRCGDNARRLYRLD